MGNIIDYIKEYGTYSFLERSFSVEDSLVLAQFSYLKLEPMLPEMQRETRWLTLGMLHRHKERERLFADKRFAKENRALFEAMRRSRRFQTMRINYYVNYIDKQAAVQFSAVTCRLEDGSAYLAFRGTDETLAGWKEDLQMADRTPLKSQRLAAWYTDKVGGWIKGTLLLGGHSKGGNLAVYAAMGCQEKVRGRIRHIYNLDGPGCLQVGAKSEAYREIAGRIHKIVPCSSVIGMLFEQESAYRMVKSSTFGILQHDPFSWILQEGRFLQPSGKKKRCMLRGQALSRWISSLSEQERKDFTEELFTLLEASEAETLLDFSGQGIRAAGRMLSCFCHADRSSRKALYRVLKPLCASLFSMRFLWR